MPMCADAAMRLDRLLTTLAVGSRIQVKTMLRAGRVTVNGQVVRSADAHVQPGDRLTLDQQPLDARTTRHVLLNKPCGVLTAARDPKQPTVLDLLPPAYRACGCMPVGRLDKDTTGLLLLTTDGTLAHRLIAPERHVDKVYEAEVEGALEEADIAAFAQGIPLKDFTALPARLEILGPGRGRVTVREGKYHQVKRMFGARGKPVLRLHRTAFGPLALDAGLAPGKYRELTEKEIAALYQAAGMPHE